MNFCQNNLSSRDECRVLTYQLENARNHLLELGLLDVTLMSCKEYYTAMQALIDASSAISALRRFASPCYMCDLEEHKHVPTPIESVV